MKIKRISKASVIEWLKRIFTLQTLAVVAGIIAALYAYKSYRDNKPTQISMDFYGFCESEKVDEIEWFINLISPDFRGNSLCVFFGMDYPSAGFPSGIPDVRNKTNKSIKDFRLDVKITYTWFEFDEKDISPDFEIVENDTALHELKLRYKYDVLNAKRAIPNPLKCMYLMDTVPWQTEKKDSYALSMTYNISYDGIPEPRWFNVHYYVYYDDVNPLIISDDYLDRFLSGCYKNGEFTRQRHNTLVSVIDHTRSKMAIPHGKLTDDKFEKFKRDFIKEYNKTKR